MIYKEERFMHITTHHILAKRRHIDAATRLRRLSHVVATSTHVVRGCKLPFPLMPSYAALHSPCGRSTRHVPILRLSEVFAASLQRPQRGKWSLQNFCKRPKEENGACRTSAKAPKEKMELAELLQRPQRGKWSLQDFCKGPKGENGACRTSANAQKEKSELAELLQMPKRRNRSSQKRCKCPEKLFGVCNNVASISRDVLAHCESSVEPLCWLYSYVKLTLTRSCFEFIE